jgi:hypothetical protein
MQYCTDVLISNGHQPLVNGLDSATLGNHAIATVTGTQYALSHRLTPPHHPGLSHLGCSLRLVQLLPQHHLLSLEGLQIAAAAEQGQHQATAQELNNT